MLTESQIISLCAAFSLGPPIAPMSKVTGGLIHSMFRLETDTGHFAVKVLDSQIMERPNIRDAFRLSEVVAAEMAAAGIPAVCALSGTQGTVADFGSATVQVYPWIDGAPLAPGPTGVSAGKQIGNLLGRIHSLDFDPSRFGAPPKRHLVQATVWRQLLEQGQADSASWAGEIETMLPRIVEWENIGYQASLNLGDKIVVGHRDLDLKNVLWTNANTPWIIDWESVGPVQPAVEVISDALDWSGQATGLPDRETFAAFLQAYRSVRDLTAEDCRLALRVRLSSELRWLIACMVRSTDSLRPMEEQDLAAQEVARCIAALRTLSEQIDAWSEWCD